MSRENTLETLRLLWDMNGVAGITGSVGGGKTSSIEHEAELLGFTTKIFLLSNEEPTTLGGVKTIDEDEFGNPITETAPNDWVREFKRIHIAGGKTMLILDEYSCASGLMQSLVMSLVTKGRLLGGTALPVDRIVDGVELFGTRIVLIMNPIEEAANGQEIVLPMKNRVCWLNWVPDADYFVKNFGSYWGAPPKISCLTEEQWAPWRARVASFVAIHHDYLSQIPKTESEREKPFPTERSWDNVSQFLARASVKHAGKDKTTFENIISQGVFGYIGEGVGSEFITWLRENDLPTGEEVAAALPNYTFKNTRIDLAMAIIGILVAYTVARCNERAPNCATLWEKTLNFLANLPTGIMDLGAIYTDALNNAKPPGVKLMNIDCKAAMKFKSVVDKIK